MAFCQVRSILFIKLWQYIVFLSLLLSGIKNTLALVNYLQSEIHFIFSSSTLYFSHHSPSFWLSQPRLYLTSYYKIGIFDFWPEHIYMYFTHPMSLPLLCKEKRFTCRITLPQDLGYENQIVVQVNGINVLNTQKKK